MIAGGDNCGVVRAFSIDYGCACVSLKIGCGLGSATWVLL